jgi:PIN domain nuclease of toxin-antitoxin system
MIVLDTQVVIWLMTDKRQLSAAASERIRQAGRDTETVAIASSTLWEVAMTYSKGGIRVPGTLGDYLRSLELAFSVLPITGLIAERSMLFTANYPKDPTDRIIGATALVNHAKLVTKDRAIRRSGEVDCVW